MHINIKMKIEDAELQNFWMVYGPDGCAGPKQYFDNCEAELCAEKLATEYPGKRFYTMASRLLYRGAPPKVTILATGQMRA